MVITLLFQMRNLRIIVSISSLFYSVAEMHSH